MYKPVFHNGTKKKKFVIDCESSKRLVHIYGVDEIKKFGQTKLWYGWSIRALIWLLYIWTLYVIQLIWLSWKTIEKNRGNYWVGHNTRLRINKQFQNV